jgi:hypothetical protein
VDWTGIWEYRLDGTSTDVRVNIGYRFDRAVASASGKYVVLYEQLGTKGIVLKKGEILREINRSFYQAHVYEYPIVFLKLPDGTEAIAHCPDHYNVIEIEEVESGKRLTSRTGEAGDFFHSRLQVSPDGRFLMSAGWFWHPWDSIQLYNLEQALRNPEILDRVSMFHLSELEEEIHTAAFDGPDRIVCSAETEEEVMRLGIYNIEAGQLLISHSVDSAMGTLMPMGKWLLSFFEHPKLIDLDTGEVIHHWPDLPSGLQNSSIIYHHHGGLPTIALDPDNYRFAIADSEKITVVELG